MITEFFIDMGTNIAMWFATLLPSADSVSGILITPTNWLTSMVSLGANLGAWIPFDALAVVFPIVMAAYWILFALKFARALFSHVPFIGGNG